MRRWAIVNVTLALLVLLLGWQIVRTWARTVPPVEVVARAPAPEAEPAPREKRRTGDRAANRAQQAPELLIAAITEKELFDPSRKAPSEDATTAAGEAVKVVEPPTGVTLVGVRIFGKDSEAFVEDTSTGQKWNRRLRPGDEIGTGWTVKTIKPTGVTLRSATGELVTLSLAIDKNKAGATSSPARGNQPAPASPAAGMTGSSPAAGVPVRPLTTTTTPAGARSATTTTIAPRARRRSQGQFQPSPGQLPAEVQQKLEQLRQGTRAGEKP